MKIDMMRYLMCAMLLASLSVSGVATADDMQGAMETKMESAKAAMVSIKEAPLKEPMEDAMAGDMKEPMESLEGMMQEESTMDSDKGSMEKPMGEHKM